METRYTTAPVEYDTLGTQTVAVVGTNRDGKIVRQVAIWPDALERQLEKYFAYGYEALRRQTAEEFAEEEQWILNDAFHHYAAESPAGTSLTEELK